MNVQSQQNSELSAMLKNAYELLSNGAFGGAEKYLNVLWHSILIAVRLSVPSSARVSGENAKVGTCR